MIRKLGGYFQISFITIILVIILFLMNTQFSHAYKTYRNHDKNFEMTTLKNLKKQLENEQRMGDDHNLCLKSITFFERYYKIPKNLLYAITIAESGKQNAKYNTLLPWPWVLNINGTPHYLQSQEEMFSLLQTKIQSGMTNIDVGCGQVNWKHHQNHFKHPKHICNPYYNVAYSAYLLSKHYNQTRNWNKAIAYYHSQTRKIGYPYLHKVGTIWKKINHNLGALPSTIPNYAFQNSEILKWKTAKNNLFRVPNYQTKKNFEEDRNPGFYNRNRNKMLYNKTQRSKIGRDKAIFKFSPFE